MATFDYIFFDTDGKKKKGSREAADQDRLIAILKAEGKMPMSITEQNMLTKEVNFRLGKGIKSRDLAIFCRQFHSILSAGVTITEALDMLGNESENKLLGKAAKEVQRSIEKGELLSQAMNNHPEVFPPIMIHMIEAGEISGSLDVSLDRIAEHYEKEAKLKAIVKKAMIYPIFICIVSIAVIFIMLLKVIPTFMEMFEEIEVKMPAITLAVVSASEFVQKFWILIIAFIILVILGLRVYISTEKGSMLFAKVSLRLPIFGKLIVKSASARFGRTLSTLLSSGVSITQALEITAKSIDNLIIKELVINARTEVERGLSIADTLELSKVLPPMVSHLIRIGEKSGNIELMLRKVADYYEEDVENTTTSMIAAMEPMMIIVLALIVGVMLLAMFQPMMKMYQGLRNI